MTGWEWGDSLKINPSTATGANPYFILAANILLDAAKEAAQGDPAAAAFLSSRQAGVYRTAFELVEAGQLFKQEYENISTETQAQGKALLIWMLRCHGLSNGVATMSRLHNKDKNHDDIFDVFKAYGASYHCTADQGNGFPDGVVGLPGATVITNQYTRKEIEDALAAAGITEVTVLDNVSLLVEVKTSKTAPLTAAQKFWHRFWDGQKAIIWDTGQVTRMIPWAVQG